MDPIREDDETDFFYEQARIKWREMMVTQSQTNCCIVLAAQDTPEAESCTRCGCAVS